MSPRVSVITPWCNRQNLGRALGANQAALQQCDAEVVVVNFGGDARELAQLLADRHWDGLRVITVEARGFNKCCAQNLGAHASRAPVLFFLDEDVVLEGDTLESALRTLAGERCFVTIEQVNETQPTLRSSPHLASVSSLVRFRELSGRVVTVETNTNYLAPGARAGPGLTCVRREHFLKVQGMNSMIHGRGWGDIDLIARLQFALELERVPLGSATHFSHSTTLPWEFDDRSRGQSEPENYRRCLENYAHARFLGTYRLDVGNWSARMREEDAAALEAR